MPAVGDIIDARCGKCKDVRRHAVVAMVGSEVVKVQCKTCGGNHKYRPETPVAAKAPKAAKAPRAPRKAGGLSAAKKLAAANAVRKEWEDLEAKTVESGAIPYNMESSFAVGDAVQHDKFGMGFVKKVILPNKIEVHFAEGVKLMICKL